MKLQPGTFRDCHLEQALKMIGMLRKRNDNVYHAAIPGSVYANLISCTGSENYIIQVSA